MPAAPPMQWRPGAGRLPRPDWPALDRVIGPDAPDDQLHAAYTGLARDWIEGLRAALGGRYRVHAAPGWLLLSRHPRRHARRLLDLLERLRRQILRGLDGLADDMGFGPHVVLLLDDPRDRADYLQPLLGAAHLPDAHGGLFIDDGYGHLLLPSAGLRRCTAVAAHELTHQLLRDRRLPVWLDEGVAVAMEQALTGTRLYASTPAARAQLQAHWRAAGLHGFWSGAAFAQAPAAARDAYALACHAVSALATDWPRFVAFARGAHPADAGDEAARQVYGHGVGDCLRPWLGEGDWSPQRAAPIA